MKEVLIKKITSRKFWALLSGVATCSLVLFGTEESQIVKITALIGSIGSV